MIGAPLDLGAGRRGVDMGPSAIRYAGLEQQLAEKLGVRVTDVGQRHLAGRRDDGDRRRARAVPRPDPRPLRPAVRRSSRRPPGAARCRSCSAATTRSRSARSSGWRKVRGRGRRRLGRRARRPQHAGDVAERQRARDGARRGARPRRRRVRARRLAAAGGRAGEARARRRPLARRRRAGAPRRLDAKVFTMSEVDRIGIEPCMREALAHAAGGAFLHVSLDMDAVDPDYAPGVGTPVRGGLSYREAHLAMEIVAESGLHRLDGRRRGQPDPRPRERDGPARRRARRLGARRAHPLARCELEVRDGDIAAVEADAVANAANDRLWMGAGVAGALKRAGGDEIEREAMAQGPIALGSAVATDGRPAPRALGDPRRRDGQDLRTDAELVRAHDALAVSSSPTSSAAARSRCPRSARESAASRSASARGSWSRRRGASSRARSSA